VVPTSGPTNAPPTTKTPTQAPTTTDPTAAPVIPIREVFASDDFDGNTPNLLSGFDPSTDNLDGNHNDFFGVGSVGNWPQSHGLVYNLADSTQKDMTGDGTSSLDAVGVFGKNRNEDDNFFALSDLREFPNTMATWSFDISNYENLELSIDMGGVSKSILNVYVGYQADTNIRFVVDVDGSCQQDAFVLDATGKGSFTTRPMDNGSKSGGGNVLEVSGANSVSKHLAEGGSIAPNTYLDKTPSYGAAAGQLDTFTTPITCNTGSVLTLTLYATLPYEAMAFDNIVISGLRKPPPAALANGGSRKLWKRAEGESSSRNRDRELYQSYWFRRYSYYGRMSCSYCSTLNSDADFYRRKLQTSSARSLHSEYEAYLSFHLTREVRRYLTENNLTCLGNIADVEVYFAQAEAES